MVFGRRGDKDATSTIRDVVEIVAILAAGHYEQRPGGYPAKIAFTTTNALYFASANHNPDYKQGRVSDGHNGARWMTVSPAR
jgi:hypothetical protein